MTWVAWVAWVPKWRGSNFGVGGAGSVGLKYFGVGGVGRNFGMGGVGSVGPKIFGMDGVSSVKKKKKRKKKKKKMAWVEIST